jgi:glycosyltransferase A (GT-A) superfamily protein (DUF2064 family)
VVLGPAVDGGYYLIGLTQAPPELLKVVPGLPPAALLPGLAAPQLASILVALLDCVVRPIIITLLQQPVLREDPN